MSHSLSRTASPLASFLLLALLAVLVVSCASNNPDEMTARPWNTPQGWEHGFPRGLLEGR